MTESLRLADAVEQQGHLSDDTLDRRVCSSGAQELERGFPSAPVVRPDIEDACLSVLLCRSVDEQDGLASAHISGESQHATLIVE